MRLAELIADELDRALRGPAWHGSCLTELLGGTSLEQAIQRPIPAAHNIWEIVLHIASWANIATRRITGGQVAPYFAEDWPLMGSMTADRWAAAQMALIEAHDNLRDAVVTLDDDRLVENAPESKNSHAVLLHGVAQHAAYHGGQIALLKKAVVLHHRRTAI